MKFWEKIFICTLIVFEIFFVPSSIYLISSSFKTNLQEAIDSAKSEQSRFCSSIKTNLAFYKIKTDGSSSENILSKAEMDFMINSYLTNIQNDKLFLEVLDDKGKKVYSDLNIDLPEKRPELDIAPEESKYIIRDINDHTYLFITVKIGLDNNYYKLSYIKDISNIYSNRRQLLNLLLKLNMLVAIILILVMIALSKFIVKPINRLIKSTKRIAEGNFDERVAVTSEDEIGTLSKNFNYMADVIKEKITELKKNSDDKQRFIDDLTHELRTPLTSIIGYADFLRTAKYDEETLINSLTYIYDEGKRLETLSAKLMQLITIKKQNFIMKKEDIEVLIAKIERSMTVKLGEKNIKLKVSKEKLDFLMDMELIIIVVTNLIDNAIKASRSGDKIYLNIYKNEESSLIIEVKDTGTGIPSDQIKKVFQPFYMVDKSRERANNGAGIGLALCKEIIDIHKGKINISSELGKGTTVKIELRAI